MINDLPFFVVRNKENFPLVDDSFAETRAVCK